MRGYPIGSGQLGDRLDVPPSGGQRHRMLPTVGLREGKRPQLPNDPLAEGVVTALGRVQSLQQADGANAVGLAP